MSVDKISGAEVNRQIITTRNSGVREIIPCQEYLFALIVNGFGIVRVPLDAPSNFQPLDLRPVTDGKYGHGRMALSDGRLWVMDTNQNKVIEVDPFSWVIVGSRSFADAGIPDSPLSCWGRDAGVICHTPEQVFRFDPNTRSVTATWSSDSPIRSTAV